MKCDDPLEMQFYFKQAIKEGWKVRELKRLYLEQKDELLMEHALQDNANQLFVAKYQLYLPKREELQAQLDRLLEI